MKKIMVVLLMIIFLVGCGQENNDANNKADDMTGVNVDVNNDVVEVTTEDGTETKVSLQDSLPLPEGYPKDVLDVYPDSFISAASHNEDGSYLVMAMSNDDIEAMIDYFKGQLEGADETMVSNVEGVYVNMGNHKSYSYTVSISESMEELGYKNSYTLIIMPSLTMEDDDMDEEDPDSGDTEDQVVMTVSDEIPEDYPSDLLPIYMEASFEVRAALEQNGQDMLAIASEEAFDITVEYYQGLLEDTADYNLVAMSDSTMVQGTIGDVFFMVIVTRNDGSLGEPEAFQSLVQIVY